MLAVDFNTEIKYDRTTKDFNLFIDGEYVGSAPTYGEGRYRLDDLVRDKLTHGDHLTATQLDGGDPEAKHCSTCGGEGGCPDCDPIPEAVNWSDRGDPPGDDPAPETGLGSSNDEGDEPPEGATDVCPSCGDQLTWAEPGLCGACQEAGETFPFLLELS